MWTVWFTREVRWFGMTYITYLTYAYLLALGAQVNYSGKHPVNTFTYRHRKTIDMSAFVLFLSIRLANLCAPSEVY